MPSNYWHASNLEHSMRQKLRPSHMGDASLCNLKGSLTNKAFREQHLSAHRAEDGHHADGPLVRNSDSFASIHYLADVFSMCSIPRTSPYCSVSILLPFSQTIKYKDDDLMLYPHPQAFAIMYISKYDESFCNSRIRTAIWKPLHPVTVYIQGIFSLTIFTDHLCFCAIVYIPDDHMIHQITLFKTVGDLLWNFATLSVSRLAIMSDMTLIWTHINIYGFNATWNAMGSIIFILGSTTLLCWQNIQQECFINIHNIYLV